MLGLDAGFEILSDPTIKHDAETTDGEHSGERLQRMQRGRRRNARLRHVSIERALDLTFSSSELLEVVVCTGMSPRSALGAERREFEETVQPARCDRLEELKRATCTSDGHFSSGMNGAIENRLGHEISRVHRRHVAR